MSETTTYTCDLCDKIDANKAYFQTVKMSTSSCEQDFHICNMCQDKLWIKDSFRRLVDLWRKIAKP